MSMSEGSGYVTPNPTCQAVGYVKNSHKVDIVTINSSGVMFCKYENTFTEIPAESSCTFYMIGESVATITFG